MAETNKTTRIQIDNVDILPGRFRNFAGEERFNKTGDRYFNIRLDENQARDLQALGLPVKVLEARDEGGDPGFMLKVSVGYKAKQPQVNFISGGVRTLLGQDTIDILDSADIAHADLIINAVEWEVNGNTGVKAWLYQLFVTTESTDLDARYANIPLAGADHADGPSFS